MAKGARGAAGAEWGRYRKECQRHQWKIEERKKERPAVYLLVKIETNSVSYVVKVGQTSRNALQRREEQKAKGYELLAHWRIREDWLLQCEAQILQAFREKYGSPVEGREAFRVKNKAYARQAMNTDAERKATEIRIRAERKAGQMMRDMEKSKGGGDVKSADHSGQREPSEYALAKESAKISDTQAKRWQNCRAWKRK